MTKQLDLFEELPEAERDLLREALIRFPRGSDSRCNNMIRYLGDNGIANPKDMIRRKCT